MMRINPRLIMLSVMMVSTAFAGQILYVDKDSPSPLATRDGSSWVHAYRYLDSAIAEANPLVKPVKIRVAQGIYSPDGRRGRPVWIPDRTATFQLISGVSIMGGYAGFGEPDPNARDIAAYETILSGDLYNNDGEVSDPCDLLNDPNRAENSYHVVTGNGTDETAVLDGFTISGGNANSSSNQNLDMIGAGMFNEPGSPILTNCKFKNNSAEWYGGGMNNSGLDSTPRLTNCTFIGNYAGLCGGGLYNNSGSPILTNCIFTGNSADAYGGGMVESQGGSQLTNCTFISNSTMFAGGGIATGPHFFRYPTLTNCLFIGNSAAERGGAMDNYIAFVVLNNCTFAENSAPNGKALACSSYIGEPLTYLQAVNCIFWDGGNEIWDDGTSSILITYSNVQGGWPGDGNNIDSDPLFANPSNGDYHLQSQGGRWDTNQNTWVIDSNMSPCIDTGNPNSDWTVELWPHGKCINMGAFGGTPEASMSLSDAGNIADLNNNDLVDYTDLRAFVNKWLYQQVLLAEDLNRNGVVNFLDFAIFTNNWLWQE